LRRYPSPCFVAIEHQDDFFEVVLEEPLLIFGKGTSYESDDARQTRLMNIEAIEKALNNHEGLAVMSGPVQIEKNQRFTKPGWETISWFHCRKVPPCVSDKSAILTLSSR
jgi:hypothetical protein